jgi:PAS domain S-box-containing protein
MRALRRTPAAIVLGLLVLLTYLWLESRSVDQTFRERVHDALLTIELHDAQLTRDVLLARAGLLSDYDSFPQTGRKLARAVEVLRQEIATTRAVTDRDLGRDVEALAEALRRKRTLVQYFTSDNALLRNSSTHFAYAGQTFGTQAGPASIATATAALAQAMLRFMQSPEPAARDAAERALDRLAGVARAHPDAAVLAAHGRLIVDVLPQVDAVLGQIVAVPVGGHTERLQDGVVQHAQRVERRARLFQFLLYLVAVVLLGYLLHQFGRLRREMVERQQATHALAASEERFRAITESASDAIISVDPGERIASWNARAEAVFGYRADEILGAPLASLVPPRYHAAVARRVGAWSTGGRASLAGRTFELAGLRRDGREFPLEVSLSTWSTAQGRYLTGFVRDLTARKQLEETTRQQELQLIQANKMTALGTLVSGMAHEINNPNHLVLMNSRVLAEAWDDAVPILDAHRDARGEFTLSGLPYAEMRETVPSLVHDVHEGALRIQRIVRDLKDFARPAAPRVEQPFALNEAVERALRLLAHAIGHRTHRFHVALAPELPTLLGDTQHVEQIVVNLVTNALEALPDPDREVRVSTALDAAERAVVLEVRDEGVGIPAEHLARVCDPFFTTRRDRGGTGLGLAITSSLVRLHGGQIRFASEPGKGTRVLVRFPLRTEA